MFRSRKRGKGEPVAVPSIPGWADLVDVASGRILLDDAPPIDVRGFDVLGQGPDEEGEVDRLEAAAFSYFGSAPKRAPEPAGEQLPLPAPPVPAAPVARGGLRLVSSAPEVEVEEEPVVAPERVSLFGSAPDLDDDEDDDKLEEDEDD